MINSIKHFLMVLRHGRSVERYCDLANKLTPQSHKVANPRIDDHEEIGSVGELSNICAQMVVKCLYLARIGRLDILWSVKKLARDTTKFDLVHSSYK